MTLQPLAYSRIQLSFARSIGKCPSTRGEKRWSQNSVNMQWCRVLCHKKRNSAGREPRVDKMEQQWLCAFVEVYLCVGVDVSLFPGFEVFSLNTWNGWSLYLSICLRQPFACSSGYKLSRRGTLGPHKSSHGQYLFESILENTNGTVGDAEKAKSNVGIVDSFSL